MKKIQFISLVLSFLIIVSCQEEKVKSNDFTKHGMVEIENQELKNAIKEIYDEIKIQEKKGIIFVNWHQDMDTSFFYITIGHHTNFLEKRAPGFYSEIEGTPVIFFTGIEYYFEFDSLYMKKLEELLKPRLLDSPVDDEGSLIESEQIYADPVIWKVSMASGKVTKKERVR